MYLHIRHAARALALVVPALVLGGCGEVDSSNDSVDSVEGFTEAEFESKLEEMEQHIRDEQWALANGVFTDLDGFAHTMPAALQERLDEAREKLESM